MLFFDDAITQHKKNIIKKQKVEKTIKKNKYCMWGPNLRSHG